MMGPLDIYRAVLKPVDAIQDMEVGWYYRVMAINRTTGEFVFEVAPVTHRKLRLRDFIFGTEPQAVILVKR